MSHYYQLLEDGSVEPRHFVPMKSDPSRSRGTRITDVKKWLKEGKKVYPSVTTILQALDKPALSEWRINQHLQTVFELFSNDGIQSNDLDGFLSKVKAVTQERLDAAPKAGTDIHKVLEDYIEKGIIPESEVEQTICRNVEAKFNELGLVDVKCEVYFANSTHGYAGCSDIVAEDKDGNRFIIDYKSKQTSEAFQKGKGKLYAEHYRQLGAYGNAIHGAIFRGAIIYVDLESGEVDFTEASENDLHNGYMDFLDCLNIWTRNNLTSQEKRDD